MMRGRWGRALWAMTAVAITGCGDDTTGSGGSGGGGGAPPTTVSVSVTSTTATATATATTTTTTTTSTGEGGGTTTSQGSGGQGGQGGQGGGTVACTAITVRATTASPGAGYDLRAPIDQALGDPDLTDDLVIRHSSEEGTFDLANPDNLATCAQCVAVLEDDGGSLGATPRIFAPTAGSMDVVDDGFPFATVTLTGVELVEVTVDEDGVPTPIDDGACLTLESAELALAIPDGWTCLEQYFAAADGCDCACGGYDPDCDDPTQLIYGCGPAHAVEDGPACSLDATCVAPPEWTCDEAAFGDGETCNCECGTPDPDCNLPFGLPPLPVEGCDPGVACLPSGVCSAVPPEWTCDPNFYGSDPVCDCNCGAYDPDCDVPENPVVGCEPGAGCGLDGECGVPAAWTCGDAAWGDGVTCDCDCGASDPDCADPNLPIPACDPGDTCVAGSCSTPAANDTCATAIPLSQGTVDGTWAGASNTYDPGAMGCTGFNEIGADVVYSVSLLAGQTLTVTLGATAADGALWLTPDCNDAAATCVGGVDATIANAPETLVYTSVAGEDLFLIVDQWGGTDAVPFQLDVSITP